MQSDHTPKPDNPSPYLRLAAILYFSLLVGVFLTVLAIFALVPEGVLFDNRRPPYIVRLLLHWIGF